MSVLSLCLLLLTFQSPRGTTEVSLHGGSLAIEYGRPFLAGRNMVEKVKEGYVWRLGADRATTLRVNGLAVFGNMVLREGAYSLFLKRVNAERWFLIVNSQVGQWGTERNPVRDILSIPLKWEKQDVSMEQLTITLTKRGNDSGVIAISWGMNVLKQMFRLVQVE